MVLVRPKCVSLPDTSTKFGTEQDIDIFMTYLIVSQKNSDRNIQCWPIPIWPPSKLYFSVNNLFFQIKVVLQVILMWNYLAKILCRLKNIITKNRYNKQTSPQSQPLQFSEIILHLYTKLTVARHPKLPEAQIISPSSGGSPGPV